MSIPQKDYSWAYALKPGDKAAINRYRPYGEPYEIITFSRATATLLVFDEGSRVERRVAKRNLCVQKECRQIEPCTDAMLEANRRYRLIRDLTNLKEAELKSLPTDVLAEFHLAVFSPEVAKALAEVLA